MHYGRIICRVKKACQNLSSSGLKNVGYGTWRLNYEVQEIGIVEQASVDENFQVTADKIIGIGNKSVYVYYYDTYRKYSESNGKDIWECKIGRTDKDPLQRILSQAGTCYPELPHIALIIQCDNSAQVEAAIHNILKIRNKWLEEAPGTEWFLTSPTEVESIYQMIVGE